MFETFVEQFHVDYSVMVCKKKGHATKAGGTGSIDRQPGRTPPFRSLVQRSIELGGTKVGSWRQRIRKLEAVEGRETETSLWLWRDRLMGLSKSVTRQK